MPPYFIARHLHAASGYQPGEQGPRVSWGVGAGQMHWPRTRAEEAGPAAPPPRRAGSPAVVADPWARPHRHVLHDNLGTGPSPGCPFSRPGLSSVGEATSPRNRLGQAQVLSTRGEAGAKGHQPHLPSSALTLGCECGLGQCFEHLQLPRTPCTGPLPVGLGIIPEFEVTQD